MAGVTRKKILTAGEGEIQFAEPIIHRLQSFLTGKEAAQTSIVSKSWHSAWLTRPNLDFDDTHFKVSGDYDYDFNYSGVDNFKKYAKKTIKRYEQLNLKIESFKLCMEMNRYGRTELAKKLIVKALRIGATRLYVRLKRRDSFVLPNEVFGADNLVELSVSGCRIKLDDGVVIKCHSLESLILDDYVHLSIDMVCKLISSCNSIENLSLLPDINPHKDEFGNEIVCVDYIYAEPYVEFGNDRVWVDDIYGGRMDNTAIDRAQKAASATAMAVGVVDNLIPRLKCLVLSYASFKTLCLGDLLYRFPFLKDFTLYINLSSENIDTIFEEGIQISNCSLERIKLVLKDFSNYGEVKRPRVKFDVPSVREFTFEAAVIPCLSFMSTSPSREWESHVSIECPQHGFSTIWFNELSELLTQLSQSKTHLSLNVGRNTSSFDYKVRDKIILGLRKHQLENLSIDMTDLRSLSCYALFDGLFRLCRPKLITQYYKYDPDKRRYGHHYDSDNHMEKTNIDFLCQTLEQGINIKVSRPTEFMYGLNDLEEVNAQAFDMDDVPADWKPIPLESLLDDDTPYKHVQAQIRTRLLLKWKPI
ncbi:hypothetical protein CASFOL_010200 [Castilleja foliolosa]|uniref:F-box domain-containing protein n=1 Tax=Castilleja foliolosa TaxID=1961234 RepID=A0ABD3DS18_9LAMI